MRFTGNVECRRSSRPHCITLVGHTSTGEPAYLTLVGEVPEELPPRLAAASVERVDERQYRISAGDRAWTMAVSQCHLHHDLSAPFYQAVPPRRVPLTKRVFWRLVLAAARTRIAAWWLSRS